MYDFNAERAEIRREIAEEYLISLRAQANELVKAGGGAEEDADDEEPGVGS